jgi:cytochrome c
MRKSLFTLALVSAGLVFAGPALASEDLAKANGCATCHDANKKKMAPSNKDLKAKHGGKADVDAIVANLKAGKGHPAVKGSDDDLKKITAWMVK